MEQPDRSPRSLARRARDVALILAATLLLFALVEGSASTVLFVHDLATATAATGPRLPATVHDPELGWVFAPRLDRPDFFGPGIGLRTGPEGRRGGRGVEPDVPPGKVRVLCSGDSFTFGCGVADSDSWCAQLEELDPRLETLNLAAAGYGLGQMHLGYRREGARLEHDAHVLALIAEDFRRMVREEFRGVPKPRLRVVDGRLVAPEGPVPPPGRLRTFRERIGPAIRELRVVRLALGLLDRLAPDGDRDPPSDPAGPAALSASEIELADRIFASTAELSLARDAPFIVLFLPVLGDLGVTPRPHAAAWRAWLREASERHGFLFLDLTPRFAALANEEISRLFIPPDPSGVRRGRGHYTRSGHAIVARAVHEALTSVPGFIPSSPGDG